MNASYVRGSKGFRVKLGEVLELPRGLFVVELSLFRTVLGQRFTSSFLLEINIAFLERLHEELVTVWEVLRNLILSPVSSSYESISANLTIHRESCFLLKL